jgi:hypothetical protein
MRVDVALKAARLGMDLIPVPPGSTGKCQPMGVGVFGVLERKQSKLYDDAMRACPGRAWAETEAVRTIIEAWGDIDANVAKSVWRRACGEVEGV